MQQVASEYSPSAGMADPHAERVFAAIGKTDSCVYQGTHCSPLVLASWRRCVIHHGLEPHRAEAPQVITTRELREVLSPLEELVDIATPEIDRLFARIVGIGAVVTLSDAGGRTLLLRCPPSMTKDVGAMGLHLGSIWLEDSQGTNGIGVCIKEQSAISIMTNDHFLSRLIDLSCTVAPIFVAEGTLAAVLNVTTSRPGALEPHALLRELLVATATRIENLWFERRYQSAGCLLRLSRFRDFNDISAEARIALDASGQVIGATANAKSTLTMVEAAPSLIGQTSSRLLGIQDRQLFEHEDGSIQLMHDDGKHIYLKSLKTRRRPERPVQRTRPQTGERQAPDIEMVVDGNPELLRQIRMAQKLVNRRLPILIQGDTGTGKTVLARALHDRSIHAAQKFVPVNCAAIPGELIESELFGYRPGAFTGAARQGSRGLILEADGGTLFLDEVGDMPLALQSRLLHVLSNGEFVPLGGGAPIKVSIAVISATLHDLTSCVRRGVFREDLYFRLAGATLIMPPLRERADRAQLIQSVLAAEALDAGRPGLRLSPEVDRLLLRHAWPGNLRELQHLMRYAVTVCDGDVIDATCLPRHLTGPLTEGPQHAKAMEREGILRMLERCAWNISAAAQHLGISRATLHRRILRFNLERPSR